MPEQQEVLIVEDDPELNELLGAYVELAGLRPRAVSCGNDALTEIRDRRPALVLLDVMLPDISGFEVCGQLRDDPGCSELPVVFLTALDREDCRKTAREYGAAAYLTKPFDPERLISVIQMIAESGKAG